VELVQRWLFNAGYTVQDPQVTTEADFRVYIGSAAAIEAGLQGQQPYIAVATEQTQHATYGAPGARHWFQRAVAVWAMDVPDFLHITRAYGVPRARVAIVPCLLGSYFRTDSVGVCCGARGVALQVGTLCPRRAAVHAAIGQGGVVTADFVSEEPMGETLACFIFSARVVYVANFYGEPCMPTLHRLAYVLRNLDPRGTVVVEACPHAPYGALLLQHWAPVVRAVPYAHLASAVTDAAAATQDSKQEAEREEEEGQDSLQAVRDMFARVAAWDGSKPWPQAWLLLSPEAVPDYAQAVPGVCLTMIVKDEEAVLRRCLDTVWPFVDAYCILDTGSTDGTQEVVAQAAQDAPKPGVFVRGQWRGFGPSRSEALAMARAMLGGHRLLFMIDADDLLLGARGAHMRLDPASASGASVVVQFGGPGGNRTTRTHLFSVDFPWEYVGLLHEYPHVAAAKKPAAGRGPEAVMPPTPLGGVLDEALFTVDARTEGVRSRSATKYADDALVLEAELERDPTNNRTLFYCAQSWRDAGNVDRAVQRYTQVAHNATQWVEERYVACMNLCDMAADVDTALPLAWLAAKLQPRRREVATSLLERARRGNLWRADVYALGLLAAEHGSDTCSADFLFARPDVYTWRFHDEFSVVAFYLQHMEVAARHMRRALAAAPEAQLPRLQSNLAAAVASSGVS
jgi:glycosyltransferase involved in cell wall biosynthesis